MPLSPQSLSIALHGSALENYSETSAGPECSGAGPSVCLCDISASQAVPVAIQFSGAIQNASCYL